MHTFFAPDITESKAVLPEDESLHCVKVLRMKENDSLLITDGKGKLYQGTIAKAHYKKCEVLLDKLLKEEPQKKHTIHIAIAPTKNSERTEWFVEKSVELGIDKISLIHCERSERKNVNTDRLKKIAISAMKQSLKICLPEISELTFYKEFIKKEQDQTNKFIAYVAPEQENIHLLNIASKDMSNLVLIGPEGDFSPEEIKMAFDNNYKPISLGKSRLRTETAGVAACHILNLICENELYGKK